MNYLDKTKAFMLIEPKNQATKEALNLPANARFVPRDHSQQPINAGPSDTTSKVSRLRIYLHRNRSPVALRQI